MTYCQAKIKVVFCNFLFTLCSVDRLLFSPRQLEGWNIQVTWARINSGGSCVEYTQGLSKYHNIISFYSLVLIHVLFLFICCLVIFNSCHNGHINGFAVVVFLAPYTKSTMELYLNQHSSENMQRTNIFPFPMPIILCKLSNNIYVFPSMIWTNFYLNFTELQINDKNSTFFVIWGLICGQFNV